MEQLRSARRLHEIECAACVNGPLCLIGRRLARACAEAGTADPARKGS
ncbi:hypothetical protein [Streptomyces hainanensis]|nr:hypothetical protein [Streptomyces hainanensis]